MKLKQIVEAYQRTDKNVRVISLLLIPVKDTGHIACHFLSYFFINEPTAAATPSISTREEVKRMSLFSILDTFDVSL